jgi:hypothetical protein
VTVATNAGERRTPTFRLADGHDAADLAAYLGRLVRYDRRAVVRLRAAGEVLGVFCQPPFGVIALRAVHLADPVDLDVTVSAGELLDRLGADGVAGVPAPVTGPAWAGLLPPRTGWRPLASAPAGALARAVSDGVAEFRTRTEALPEQDRTRAQLDRIAEAVWARPLLAGLPLRAAHAAHALGFLAGTGDVTAHRAAGWLRLDAVHGSVAVRLSPALPLSVLQE